MDRFCFVGLIMEFFVVILFVEGNMLYVSDVGFVFFSDDEDC